MFFYVSSTLDVEPPRRIMKKRAMSWRSPFLLHRRSLHSSGGRATGEQLCSLFKYSLRQDRTESQELKNICLKNRSKVKTNDRLEDVFAILTITKELISYMERVPESL